MDKERPRRFIVIPKMGLADEASTPARTVKVMRASASGARARASRSTPKGRVLTGVVGKALAPMSLHVVNRSPSDGAVLVEAPAATISQVKARAPEGAKVFEEQWYRLQRARGPWHLLSATFKRPYRSGQKTRTLTVTVRLDKKPGKPLSGVLVTAMVDEDKGIGAEATTDRYGRATFKLSAKTTQLETLYADPLHSGWPVALPAVPVTGAGILVKVLPIDLRAVDARGLVYGKAPAAAGKKVTVGVLDTGVGKHSAIKVAGGRNTTEESPQRYGDFDGHGTHVAGVIAASATGWRRGEASAVALRAYRIFEEGEDESSTFAISAAIKQAALDGCDLINMSIGGGPADGSIGDAIDQAWEMGCVCIAATGNDGVGQVDYPARYPKSLAVSAIGLQSSWPAGTALDWTIGKWHGKVLGGLPSFLASFSNRGDKVALTAPGVAIVSTIFGNRWGVMSGTSMATPVATGVLARRLAASPVFAMPRDAARAAAILALAKAHAEDLGLASTMQGEGLAR